MSSISGFIGNFSGGARPNRYKVTLSKAGDKLDLFCKAASLPGTNIGTCEVPYMGRIVKVAGDRTFDDWTITVINDIGFAERIKSCEWNADINLHNGNTGSGGLDYFDSATVIQLGRDGAELATVTIMYVFPISVGEITLGWDQNDQVEEYELTLAYNYWTGTGAT